MSGMRMTDMLATVLRITAMIDQDEPTLKQGKS